MTMLSDTGVPPSQLSPLSPGQGTNTTYSLPYYHNLFARTQPQDGRRVHATTYVPEIGTISSPVVGAPSVINVIDTKHRLREKLRPEESQEASCSPKASPSIKHKEGQVYKGESGSENDRTTSDSNACNNRICVQTDTKSVSKHMSSPSDFKCSDINNTIDLSVKKRTVVDSGSKKEKETESVINKREALHSPQNNDDDKNVVHDLRKCQTKMKDSSDPGRRTSEKRKACDLNHNSKDHNEVAKKSKRSVPLTVSDDKSVIIVDEKTGTDTDKRKTDRETGTKYHKDTDKEHGDTERKSSNGAGGKQAGLIQPLVATNDLSDKDKKNGKPITFSNGKSESTSNETNKSKSVGMKLSDGNNQSNGMHVISL